MWSMIFGAWLAALSLIAFFLYASDKRRAKRQQRRIPEKTLLGISFLGGAIGGYAAMLCCRHKTRHWYFHAVNLLGIAWQAGLLVWLLLF